MYKNPCVSRYWFVFELLFVAAKLWHLLCFSSSFTPGYWLPSLCSKSLKSLFVVTVTPARCCRLHFDVRDSLQDLVVVKCNCTEPKTKWQIDFFYSLPPSGPLVWFWLYWSWEPRGLCGLVCAANVILHYNCPARWNGASRVNDKDTVFKPVVSIEGACLSSLLTDIMKLVASR